jgi:hypothetical protein
MADKSSGEEDELRRWFRLNGLEAPNPSGHFDAHRWRARTPVPLPARSQFIAAVVAFLVVLGAGAVWLHGRGTGGDVAPSGGTPAAGQCGIPAVKAAEEQYPPLANLPDGGEILYSTTLHPCFWKVTFTSAPPSTLLSALLLRGVRVSWSSGIPSPKRPTPVLPMSPVAPGDNINPVTPTEGPS